MTPCSREAAAAPGFAAAAWRDAGASGCIPPDVRREAAEDDRVEMTITFPGGDRVDASWGGFTVITDQDGSAPNPFALFLASIGTCAGIYVAGFCRKRGIDVAGARIVQRMDLDTATGHVRHIDLDVELPSGFPEAYRHGVVKAASLCKVKRHLENPPEITVRTTVRDGASA